MPSDDAENTTYKTDRRSLLGSLMPLTLSVATVGLLAACQANSSEVAIQSADDVESDVDMLNIALGLEHEAIAAYEIAASSGLLEPSVAEVGALFAGHHRGHRDALAATIATLGGRAVEAQSLDSYAARLEVENLRNQADVLVLARTLELQAANAYLGVIPAFRDSGLAKTAGRLAADETMHWTVLAQATGEPLPVLPLTLGA